MGTDIHAVWQAKKDDAWVDVPSTWKQDRHYYLFAWLADVRNGFGFAGVYTHEPLKPVVQARRGLPSDFEIVDNEYHPSPSICLVEWQRDTADEWKDGLYLSWMGDHSRSWLTADEILDARLPDEPEHLQYFLEEVRRLKAEHGTVRLVFGFDS